MKPVRIIPRLDVKGPNLVKGIHLEGLRVIGDPDEFSELYAEYGADEIHFQDIVASLYGRNNLHDIVERTAKNLRIPLTVGGGVRSLEDIRKLLRVGADKVSINTQAVKRPEFIGEAAKEFGSSTIVVAIEASKDRDGNYYLFTDNGRETTGVKVLNWIDIVQNEGAGEVMLTSIDREGTFKGFDMELLDLVKNRMSIPLIVHGGINSIEDILEVIENGADALAMASTLHYNLLKQNVVSKGSSTEGNREFVHSKSGMDRTNTLQVQEIKRALTSHGYVTRRVD